MSNFNEVFREDVTYDNIKSRKKPGSHPLFRRNIFRKTTGRVELTTPAVSGLKKSLKVVLPFVLNVN